MGQRAQIATAGADGYVGTPGQGGTPLSPSVVLDSAGGATTLARQARKSRLLRPNPLAQAMVDAVAPNPIPNIVAGSNPSFETNTLFGSPGWQDDGGGTVAQSTDYAYSGTYSMKLTAAAAVVDLYIHNYTGGITPGQAHTFSIWTLTAATLRTWNLTVTYYDASHNNLGSTTGANVTDVGIANWQRLTVTATAPANAAYFILAINSTAALASSEVHYFDGFQVTQTANPIPYADSAGNYPTVTVGADNGASKIAVVPNLQPNPSFESSISGWSDDGGGTVAQSTDHAYDGTHSLKYTSAGSGAASVYLHAQTLGIVAGQPYQASAYVWAASTVRSWNVTIKFYNSTPSLVGTITGSFTPDVAGAWTRVAVSGVAPAGATEFIVILSTSTTPANGEIHYIDAIEMTQSAITSLGINIPPFPQSGSNWWQGNNASKSLYMNWSDTAFTNSVKVFGGPLISYSDLDGGTSGTADPGYASSGYPRYSGWGVEFMFDGSAFEFGTVGNAGAAFLVWVDGQPAPQGILNVDISGGQHNRLVLVDFGSRAHRHIVIEACSNGSGLGFTLASIRYGPTDTVTFHSPSSPARMIVLGDSYTQGTAATDWLGTWVRRCARRLGIDDFWPLGESGTGFVATGSGTNYVNRLTPNVYPYAPDLLVLQGSVNDLNYYSTVQAAAETVIQDCQQSLPDTLLVLTGILYPGSLSAFVEGSTLPQVHSALQAAATATGCHFIDTQSPTPWCTGSGRVGAPQGDGCADQYVESTSPYIHPTDTGHAYLGDRMADAILKIIAAEVI